MVGSSAGVIVGAMVGIVALRARFCGYLVANPAPVTTARRQRSRPLVVATGGGEVLEPLLRTFLDACNAYFQHLSEWHGRGRRLLGPATR